MGAVPVNETTQYGIATLRMQRYAYLHWTCVIDRIQIQNTNDQLQFECKCY